MKSKLSFIQRVLAKNSAKSDGKSNWKDSGWLRN